MKLIYTADGSISAYNDAYNDYYHDRKGALFESIYKHIYPAFHIINKPHIRILDLCFGLGYNSLLTLVFAKRINVQVEIYSVESDLLLLESLYNFPYPKIISNYLDISNIIKAINNDMVFMDYNVKLSVFRGDAIDFLHFLKDCIFDIVYQDAFSPSKNPLLWNKSHFLSLYEILCNQGVITTYSSAQHIRNIAKECGFGVFDMKFNSFKNGSLFTKNINIVDNLDSIEFSLC